MDIKITYTAIVAAVLLGATSVGQFFVISHLRAEIRLLQPPSVTHGFYVRPPGDDGQARAAAKKLFSGGTPPPAQQP